jgi:hypothetical protein
MPSKCDRVRVRCARNLLVSLLALRQMLPLPEHMPLIIVRLCLASVAPLSSGIWLLAHKGVPFIAMVTPKLSTDCQIYCS